MILCDSHLVRKLAISRKDTVNRIANEKLVDSWYPLVDVESMVKLTNQLSQKLVPKNLNLNFFHRAPFEI